MVWIITSNDWSDNREGEHSYTNEAVFLAGLQELLQNPKKEFISATLPTGKVLDELAARVLVGQPANLNASEEGHRSGFIESAPYLKP